MYKAMLVLVAGMALIFTACGDDDEGNNSLYSEQIEKLSGTWKATDVTLDDTQQPGYQDFTIKLSGLPGGEGLGYIITNNPEFSPWISAYNGRLIFDASDPSKHLIREDDVAITYDLSGTTLTLSFVYNEEDAGGRVSGVTGTWKFTFEKQP